MGVAVETVTSGGLPYRIVGSQRETTTKVTFDSSYAEGGEPLTPANLGLNIVEGPTFATIVNGPEAEKFVAEAWYTPSTEKIHLQDAKTGKELAKETNCEKVVVNVVARGR